MLILWVKYCFWSRHLSIINTTLITFRVIIVKQIVEFLLKTIST